MPAPEGVLPRTLGFPSAVCLIVGTVIGSGIFASPGFVVEGVGSPGAALVIWGACGAATLAGALTYAELGALFPHSGGEAVYLPRCFPAAPALPFMYTWVIGGFGWSAGGAALAIVASDYLCRLWWDELEDAPAVARRGIGVAVIAAFASCQLLSTRAAAAAQDATTWLKLALIALLIAFGVYEIGRGGPYTSQLAPSNAFSAGDHHSATSNRLGDWANAVTKCLFAYAGWSALMLAAGEVRDPYRNIPAAAGVAISLITFVYVWVNAAYFVALPVEDDGDEQTGVSGDETIAITFAEVVAGSAASTVVTVGVALSAMGAYNGTLFATARLVHSAARGGVIPSVFGRELSAAGGARTPAVATAFCAGVAALLVAALGDFCAVVDIEIWTTWLFYGVTGAGMLRLRVAHPELERPYRAPTAAPVVLVAVALYVCVFLFVEKPVLCGVSAAVVAAGYPMFVALRRWGVVAGAEQQHNDGPAALAAEAAQRAAEREPLSAAKGRRAGELDTPMVSVPNV